MLARLYFDEDITASPGMVVKCKFLGLMRPEHFSVVDGFIALVDRIVEKATASATVAFLSSHVVGNRAAFLIEDGDQKGNVLITSPIQLVTKTSPSKKMIELLTTDSYMKLEL